MLATVSVVSICAAGIAGRSPLCTPHWWLLSYCTWRTNWLRRQLLGFGFYALFAFAVTVSVQLVGIYLVFASLIIPALATHHFARRGLRIACGYGVGATGCLMGLLLSVSADLPAGAVIVWSLGLTAVAFAWAVWPFMRHGDKAVPERSQEL